MKEINIGMLVNTHGLRGEMKVKVLTDFPQLRFQKGAVVHLQLAQGQLDSCLSNLKAMMISIRWKAGRAVC